MVPLLYGWHPRKYLKLVNKDRSSDDHLPLRQATSCIWQVREVCRAGECANDKMNIFIANPGGGVKIITPKSGSAVRNLNK